jgi:pimeloyl-ACP methyl ester carboxylesterase/DNA-binding CsgD family transcriptional regulator
VREIRIAYQVVGNGPIDLVVVPSFVSNLEILWEDPGYAHQVQRLSAFSRLILLDKRGTGLSDRVDGLQTIEQRTDDIRAVMDAAGSRRAVVLGCAEGAAMALRFAASQPKRVRGLILYGGYAEFTSGVMGKDALADFLRVMETGWGTGASLTHCVPGRVCDPRFQAWWARFERLSATPTAAASLVRMNAGIDVRAILGEIAAPTLIMHRSHDSSVTAGASRYLAQRIRDSRLVELDGHDHAIWIGDIDRIVDEIEEFLTGTKPLASDDRLLAVIVVAKLATPNRLRASPGQSPRAEGLANLHKAAREIVARHGGRTLGTDGEEIGARFDRPGAAVRCAIAIKETAAGQGLEIGIGVHAGEIEIREDHVVGLSIHVAQQIASRARGGSVLVSGVVAELATGSELKFAKWRSEEIDGLDDPLRLFIVEDEIRRDRLSSAPVLDALSPREREVLELIAEGRSNAAIADKLLLSEHTVKRHVANILMKLELPTRAAAAALAASQH